MREMALAAGVRALVVASIRRFDNLYAIDLKVLDPSTSEYFFTLKEERAGKAAIPAMIDRLSEKARERLRETPAQVSASRVNVAEATTRSYQAWQQYFEGLKLEGAIRYSQAIARYRKAVELDPRFALAWYRIAYLGEFVWLPEEERRAAMDAALQEVDRVPAKERLLFLAWKAHMETRNEDAHALYARAGEAFPQDKDVLYLAGDLYFQQWRYAEALPWFEKALALDPVWPEALGHVVEILGTTGLSDEAVARARRWVEQAPGTPSRVALADALLRAGHRDEAVEVARQTVAKDPGNHSWDRAGPYPHPRRPVRGGRGSPQTARDGGLRRQGWPRGRACSSLSRTRVVSAGRAAGGHPRVAPRVSRVARCRAPVERARGRAGRATGPPGGEGLRGAGDREGTGRNRPHLLAARGGRRRGGGGDRVAGERSRSPEAIRRPRGVAARGRCNVARGDPRARRRGTDVGILGVVARLRRVRRRPVLRGHRGHRTFREDEAPESLARWRLGQAPLPKGHRPGATWRHRGGAQASVERLLGWWRRADPDLPLLAETRALCRKLGCQDPAAVARK